MYFRENAKISGHFRVKNLVLRPPLSLPCPYSSPLATKIGKSRDVFQNDRLLKSTLAVYQA